MKTKALTSLFAVALALVACNKNETEPAFTPELKLDKTAKITAVAEGTTATLKVTANVSWTATSDDETVATVTPASKDITDKKSADTDVTVTISENTTTDPRTATLTFKAEGCKDIVVEIEQAAAEIPDVFEVLDNTGEQPAPSSFDFAFAGESVTVYVNSNINWTATSSDEDWLSATPASFTAESKEAEPTAVTIAATANTGAARSATITFSAAGQQDVVITINQAVAPTLEISVDNITYNGADITFTSSSTTTVYFPCVFPKSDFDEIVAKGYTAEDLVHSQILYLASNYKVTPAAILEGLGETETATLTYTLSDPETEYIAIACFFDSNVTPLGEAATKVFTSAARPAPEGDYENYIGTWKVTAYNEDTKANEDFYLYIEEVAVNEYYLVNVNDFVEEGDGWYAEYIPAEGGSPSYINLENGYVSDWGYSYRAQDGTSGLGMSLMAWDKNEDFIESVTYTLDGSEIELSLATPEESLVCYSVYGYLKDAQSAFGRFGYYCDVPANAVFSKVTAPAAKQSAGTKAMPCKVKHQKHQLKTFYSKKSNIARKNYVEK